MRRSKDRLFYFLKFFKIFFEIFFVFILGEGGLFPYLPPALKGEKTRRVGQSRKKIKQKIKQMEKKLVELTAEAVNSLRKEAGQSEKRITNSAAEFAAIPEIGEFAEIGMKQFTLRNGQSVMSIGLFTTEGFFISENAIFSSTLTSELFQISKNSTSSNAGKWMLRQERLNPKLWDLAPSADKRLIALVGRGFKTSKIDGLVYKSEVFKDISNLFVPSNTAGNLKKLTDKTEVKTLYKFELL